MDWKADVYTVLERDPAPRSFGEALMFSPGLHAILMQRVSHNLYQRGQYKIARLINYWSRVFTGADIHRVPRSAKAFSSIMPPAW